MPVAGTGAKFPFFKPDRDFQIRIAITIPIENISGKIDNRFSDQNRSAISPEKSIPIFILNLNLD